MIKNIVYILLLIILSHFSVFAQNEESVLNIKSNINEARIYVDDNFVGNGSVEIKVNNGVHIIFLINSNFQWDKFIIKDTINVSGNDSPYNLEYTFDEEKILTTIPNDVYVFSNNILIGHTPYKLPASLTELRLSKPNYSSRTLLLNEANLSQPTKLNFVGEPKGKSFVDTYWFEALIGSAVVLGVTAAYFKLEADNMYEDYLITRDPSELEKIDQYDAYSGAALGLLQINFGIIIFKLLTD